MNSQTTTSEIQAATQGQAVVQAIREALKSDYKEGSKVALSEDQRKRVTEILVQGFIERRILLKASPSNDAKLNDPKQLHAYVKGLINNWLTKSPALNGKPAKVKSPLAATIKKEPAQQLPTKDEPAKAKEQSEPKKTSAAPIKK